MGVASVVATYDALLCFGCTQTITAETVIAYSPTLSTITGPIYGTTERSDVNVAVLSILCLWLTPELTPEATTINCKIIPFIMTYESIFFCTHCKYLEQLP